MELRQLRQFIAVAEELHFARAAERLGMEQSPLSRSIRDLEIELKVRLFNRTTRRTWLTQPGERFLESAKRVLADVDAAIIDLRRAPGMERMTLRLGLAEHAAGATFARLLMELARSSPPITADLRELTPSEVLRHVADGGLDLGLLLEHRAAPGLCCEPGWSEPLVLVVPVDHPLAEREQVAISDAGSDAFVLPSPEAAPGLSKQVQRFLYEHGVHPINITHAAHQNSMLSLIATGIGVGVMAEPFTRGPTDVRVIPLVDEDATLTTWLLYRKCESSDVVAAAVARVASLVANGVAGRGRP